MNNKLLSVVLVLGIASTGFAAISSANDSASGSMTTQMHQLFEKIKSGTELTAEEQAQLDAAKAQFGDKMGKRGIGGFGKRAGFDHLTDDEITALASMNDDEKKAFFYAKKVEMEAQKEAGKAVISKLIAGEPLTAAEESTRLEMLAKMTSENNDHPERRDGGDIIAKLLAGDALTADEQTQLAAMQAKHAEREAEKVKIDAMSDTEKQAYFAEKKVEMDAKMQIIKPLLEKLRNGETLTAEEQTTLDTNTPEMIMGKGFGAGEKRGRGYGPKGDDFDGDNEREMLDDTEISSHN